MNPLVGRRLALALFFSIASPLLGCEAANGNSFEPPAARGQGPDSLQIPSQVPSRATEASGTSAETKESYASLISSIEKLRKRHERDWSKARDSNVLVGRMEADIVRSVQSLSSHWLGTPWGLGTPQSSAPGHGKINCGTFVGTLLRDAGFVVNVKKLQRQPSQLIIRSFVSGKRMKKFSNASMKKFLSETRAMGPGLFVIGLDFHVGFLVVKSNLEVRFIHASYETGTVVNELADTAMPIETSGYRVIGKLLTRENLRDWREGNRIKVVGDW